LPQSCKREKQVDSACARLLGCARELQFKPAAYQGAATEQRGSRVLIVHEYFTNPLPDGGGFLFCPTATGVNSPLKMPNDNA
jgi:hypothetical protein